MISIIIPVYNTAQYLERCIDSIITQSFSDYEVILINDGSTDESLEICTKYSLKWPKVSVISKENEGVSVARNFGLKYAVGEYIWFVDSDDFLAPESLSNLNSFLERYKDIDIVTCSHYDLYPDGNVEQRKLYFESSMIPYSRHQYYVNMLKNTSTFWAPWKNIYRRKLIEDNSISFLSGVICAEDCDFFMKYVSVAENFYFLDTSLIYYRTERFGSATNSMSSKAIADRLSVYSTYSKSFSNYRFVGKIKLNSYFANKFANAVSDIYRLNKTDHLKEVLLLIENNKQILKKTIGMKYLFARVIWYLFGFYNGSKYLYAIRQLLRS